MMIIVLDIRHGFASYTVERMINGTWMRRRTIQVSKGSEARKFLLDKGERIIVEGESDTEVVIDKEQMAAVHVPRGEISSEVFEEEVEDIPDISEGLK